MKLSETYHKFNLVIITSFCQSKNLNSFRLPLRRLWRKDVKHLKLNHSDRIFQNFAHIFDCIFNETLFPLHSVRITRKGVGRVVSGNFVYQNILSCCFLKPEQPNVEATSGTDQLPLIRHIKLVAGQRGQDVAATECFLYFFLDILAFTYTV